MGVIFISTGLEVTLPQPTSPAPPTSSPLADVEDVCVSDAEFPDTDLQLEDFSDESEQSDSSSVCNFTCYM